MAREERRSPYVSGRFKRSFKFVALDNADAPLTGRPLGGLGMTVTKPDGSTTGFSVFTRSGVERGRGVYEFQFISSDISQVGTYSMRLQDGGAGTQAENVVYIFDVLSAGTGGGVH